MVSAACAPSQELITVTVTQSPTDPLSSQVAAPALSTAAAPSAAPTTTSTASSVSTATGSNVRISAKPGFGSKNVPPNDPVTITVFAAKISQLTMTGDDGTQITGAVAADQGSWVSKERLDYATVYTVAGTAQANDGKQTKITGKISTVKPADTERAAIQIPQNGVVGVGAPIIVTFSGVVKNRAAVERALKVTTSAGAALQGNWGWLQDEDILGKGTVQSQVHWRPTASPVDGTTPYWPANTKVHVEADLKGVDYGGGQWGRGDFTSDFTIGRSQIVVADASTFHLIVTVDDQITKNYAVSYGKESVPGRGTLNGIHLVTEKYPTFSMCNPEFDYCNKLEKWAVRINNNGEFIHENLLAAKAFGIANVSHGCINMGAADAKGYYDSAIYGDPVIVSNTGGPQMSEKDALYDWIYSPAEWKALSAL